MTKQSEIPIPYIRKAQLLELLGKLEKELNNMLEQTVHFDVLRADVGEFIKVRITVEKP